MSVCVFSSRDPTRELGAKWEPTNRQPTLSPVCDICMRILYRRCLPVRVSSAAPGSAGSGLSSEWSVPSLPRLYRRALRARIRYLAHPPAWHSRRARPRLSVRCVAGVLRAHAWLAWASCRCCVACLFFGADRSQMYRIARRRVVKSGSRMDLFMHPSMLLAVCCARGRRFFGCAQRNLSAE